MFGQYAQIRNKVPKVQIKLKKGMVFFKLDSTWLLPS
jgi:hypothetical protein